MSESLIPKPIQMSREEAVAFFADLFRGEHHIPAGDYVGAKGVKPCRHGWKVVMFPRDYLSTHDGDTLTRAVFLAHDKRFRLEVSAVGGKLCLAIHPRLSLEAAGDFPTSGGHPTLGEAVGKWRKAWPLKEEEMADGT